MKVINANCPDEALYLGLIYLEQHGERHPSRNGAVLVSPTPVTTCNHQPTQRVLFNAKRDANPFFHLMEALWMLAGRNDSKFLNGFVSDFGARFAEPDGRLHGAYGFRWRSYFDVGSHGGEASSEPDQLTKVCELLTKNPDDRRVVITMWDPVIDLGGNFKDIPCNTHIYPRVRRRVVGQDGAATGEERFLDLTVCCRSNDAIWGAHGANVVHFSVLQEYLAAHIGVGVGVLYQVSNNYHAYASEFDKVHPMDLCIPGRYSSDAVSVTKIVEGPNAFDQDLAAFFEEGSDWDNPDQYIGDFFSEVAVPMRVSYARWRAGMRADAREIIRNMPILDWSVAAGEWYDRRLNKEQSVASK